MTRQYGPCALCCGGLWLKPGETCPAPSCGRSGPPKAAKCAARVRYRVPGCTPPNIQHRPCKNDALPHSEFCHAHDRMTW